MKIITLSNGVKVANFSSPHAFTFTDGNVLPAVSAEEADRLKVTFIEDIDEDGDVSLTFDISNVVVREIMEIMEYYEQKVVDKVLIPLPLMTALKTVKGWDKADVKAAPFRCVRIEDRVKKLVSIEKWCI